MKYLVLSFLHNNNNYQVNIDKGSGLEMYMMEYQGTLFSVIESSPIRFVSNYCEENGYEIIQVVEEDGYNHLRFYLKKTDAPK